MFSRYWIDGIFARRTLPVEQRLPNPRQLRHASGRGIRFYKDRFRNDVAVVSGHGNEIIFENPDGRGQDLLIGLFKDHSKGDIRVLDATGQLVFEANVDSLKAPTENYWNQFAHHRISLDGFDTNLIRIHALEDGMLGIGPLLIR